MGHQQRRQQEDVLGPLVDADRLEERARQRTPVEKSLDDRNLPYSQRETEAESGIGKHRLARVGQQRQIGAGVADVVEFAEVGFEEGELFSAGEVCDAVGGQNAGKDAEMSRHALGQWAIGAGGQVELAALAPLTAKVADELGVVGQPGDIERSAAGHLRLEACAAPGQPERQLPETGRIAVHELADGIEEGVGLDQRAVEIDAERANRLGVLDLLDWLGDLGILEQGVLLGPEKPDRPPDRAARKTGTAARKSNTAVGKLSVKYTVKRQLAEINSVAG